MQWGPYRTDTHIDTTGAVDRWVHSTCNLCSIGCGTEIAVKDNHTSAYGEKRSTTSTSAGWIPKRRTSGFQITIRPDC